MFKNVHQSWKGVLVLCFVVVMPYFSWAKTESGVDATKAVRVLVLMDQSPLLPRNVKIHAGLSEGRKDLTVPVLFFQEVTGIESTDPAAFQDFDRYLRNKYSGQSFDYIVSAWVSGAAYAQVYWPNTPLINLSIFPAKNTDQQVDLALNIVSRIERTIDLAAQLNPKPTHCTVIQGDLPTDSPGYAVFEQRLPQYCNAVSYLTSHTTKTLVGQLSKVDENGWVFYFPSTFNDDGMPIIPRHEVPYLSAASPSPVFGFNGQMLGQGIVGGELIDPKLLGYSTIEALNEHIATGAFTSVFRSTFLGIDEVKFDQFFPGKTLPRDAVIVNPLPPLLSDAQIKALLFVTSGLVVLLLLAGVALMKKSNRLSASNEQLILQSNQIGELVERLQKEIAIKDKFFSIIAHDLRSPFTTLIGMTQAMSVMPDKFSKEKFVELSGDIHNASKHIFKLLENLLDWSRLQMAGFVFEPQTHSVSDIVGECLALLGPIAKTKEITLVNDVDADVKVFADRNMVLTVVRNLLSNAIKFSHVGGRVKIETREDDGFVSVSVTDTGVGMTAAQMTDVFSLDHKTTTKGTAGEKGTGLGLPLSKEMVERNDGTIFVTSHVGEGTTFVFTLPAPN